MTYLSSIVKNRLEEKLSKLNKLRPLPKSAVQKLREKFQIEMTYNSNAIEGNSLTLKETFLVINEGLTVKGKPLKDHLEAKDHHTALEYLYDLIDKDKKHTISEMLIRNLHQIIIQETDKEWAGKYRNANVIIGGAKHTPTDALQVQKKMHDLISWLNQQKNKTNIIELAALLHHKLVHIHPFFDGNGRTARLTMNLLLMQAGYPLVIILKNDRKKYYDVLEMADGGKYEPLVKFIAQSIERSLDIYLKTLTPATTKQEKFISLTEISKTTPFSAKYLNLLARQGKLEAYKEGRNWLTSKEAIERYLKNRTRQRKN
ncbi:MAG: Filamentation induced by cAMP protein Fic [Candidatus Uhrbacteria bacterium GW2011_GWD1_41_16]|uniref:Filamentation induced by cAMP protein Fic n=1 Tax=Candidatus Uhrbacteria bacterium GW2011_GWC1_41_20 TaxID=1618983 RepID=A0A0G0VF07_9BACT|nr:MAG: Filamentation induced by cAMP protein Fic [Candidatus Uhrbacteria bacterium GW2011_GWE1_39_46]KKR63647.1 MAG: Filamentation induced by cAMP protein Fic [Candidatus Uhrbacteria bacterium GW2011_GWC2_40_450]KKR96419.1 MAG: Filamentation induced by cAMP protein Fic [Candidatus Uhrbacteria bacterium GW2011_GWD1_41_16]KKR99433.1 MAG: Filamentation induced by cAMP protein Fic [Candidatus Uhrbacteria bacterium GW2011_GWC1_41_20]KKS08334.1 MAG: Filamentation induced by cAMP protein Fic [Candida